MGERAAFLLAREEQLDSYKVTYEKYLQCETDLYNQWKSASDLFDRAMDDFTWTPEMKANVDKLYSEYKAARSNADVAARCLCTFLLKCDE